ncbi:MAG: Hsp20/alpha crystallin family protein [Halobacteriaceae archaeon]
MSERSNPFDELEQLFDRMSRQFDDASRMWDADRPFAMWRSQFQSMAIDLVEHDDEFVATVDLPGFERDDVEIRVSDHTLHIEADQGEDREEMDDHYLHRERSHRSVDRSIRLPEEVAAEDVSARLKNGVLTITLPKAEPKPAHRIEIE